MATPRVPGAEPTDDTDIEAEPKVYPMPAGRTWHWDYRWGWGGYPRDSEDDPQRSANVDAYLARRRERDSE